MTEVWTVFKPKNITGKKYKRPLLRSLLSMSQKQFECANIIAMAQIKYLAIDDRMSVYQLKKLSNTSHLIINYENELIGEINLIKARESLKSEGSDFY